MSKLRQAITAAVVGKLRLDEAGGARTFLFGADFPGFSGHFPGYPVLPALVQVLAAQAVVEELTGHSLTLSQLERAKFMLQLRPDCRLQVCCRQRRSGERTVWEARLEAGEELAATFWMSFAEKEAQG